MKSDIHPQNYRLVIFKDASSGAEFLVGSTVDTKETGKFGGKEYPLFSIETSSASHPVYTGGDKVLDTEGRAEKFKARMVKSKAKAKK